jgi:glycosyltransferase involved in cell wall biosynthesis
LLIAFLDSRARELLNLPRGSQVTWVRASVGSRLACELALRRVAIKGTMVFCFHGLPPVIPNYAHIIVFQQNRIYFELSKLPKFTLKTRLRLCLERYVSRIFRKSVYEYIVQTHSMQRSLLLWYTAFDGYFPRIRVLPFAGDIFDFAANSCVEREWDFVYVADGEAHKNHCNLLRAWELLAQDNLRPSLALTLSSRDAALRQKMAQVNEKSALQIRDLGQMPHKEVVRLYANARALIFPSTSESFGLPLIEASHLGLPILASELDYVRDVCVPAETFDPNSPVSIARAVKRFLECPEPPVNLKTPTEFWGELLRNVPA